MFDCGMSLKDIAAHFGVSVGEVIEAIRQRVREEREALHSLREPIESVE